MTNVGDSGSGDEEKTGYGSEAQLYVVVFDTFGKVGHLDVEI